MPTKDDFYCKGGILFADEEFYKIDRIEPCTLEDEGDIAPDKPDFIRHDEGFSFDCNISGMNSGDLFRVLTGACTLEQLAQNNWRRIHGLPMRRKTKR